MRHARLLSALSIAMVAAGCAAAPHAAQRVGAMSVRADGFETRTLQDFESDPYMDFYGPHESHPLMAPTAFYYHGRAGLAEVVAARGAKPRKGMYVGEVEDGSLSFDDDPDDDKPGKLATRVRASFKWAINAEPTSETAFPAMATFVFAYKTDKGATETRHLTYAASNVLPVGAVISRKMRWDDEEIDGRILVIERGNGLGQPANETAFELLKAKMATPEAAIVKDFVASVRYAWDPRTAQTVLDGATAPSGKNAPAAPSGPIPPLEHGKAPNKEILEILGVAVGAETPKGVSAHALIDELAVLVKERD